MGTRQELIIYLIKLWEATKDIPADEEALQQIRDLNWDDYDCNGWEDDHACTWCMQCHLMRELSFDK